MEQTRRSKAYTADGFIVNQALLHDVRYGAFTADYNGCGWIAAYNVLHALQLHPSDEALRAELSKHSLFRGRFGTSPRKLARCLKRQGLTVRCALRRKKAAFSFGGVRAGVVLYRHAHGIHYVAFVPTDDGRLHFYNDIPGKADHIERMETFLMRESTLPAIWLLTVR